MELYEALRQLTDQYGYNIVSDYDIIPMLSRKRCFTNRPELKKLYHSLINVGYAQRIIDLIGEEDWQGELGELANTFYYRLDYDVDDVIYVFCCVAYGVGLFDDIDVYFNDVEEEDVEEDTNGDDGNYDFYADEKDADFEDIDTDNYSISQQYHEKKDINIYVVRPKERLDSSSFDDFRRQAKQYGNGYYSTFRGVNGFVFNIPDDAIAFAEEVIGKKTIADIEDNLNNEITNKRLSKPQNQKFDKSLLNMELHIALKNVIDTDGVDIINEIRLVNILDDLKAFESIPASKYILRAIITDGYTRKLRNIGSWNASTQKLSQHFSQNTGFQPDYVDLIFQSIIYALGGSGPFDNLTSNNTNSSNNSQSSNYQNTNGGLNMLDLFDLKTNYNNDLGVTVNNLYVEFKKPQTLLLSFEINGAFNTSFFGYISVIIYNKFNQIVQRYKGEKIYSGDYQGFMEYSYSIRLKCEVSEIGKIVMYYKPYSS